MYCFTLLINRLQNYSLRLCLKYVLLTGMSDVFIASSETHTTVYIPKKMVLLGELKRGINGKLRISHHLSSEPGCQDQREQESFGRKRNKTET